MTIRWTIGQCVGDGARRLAAAGIAEPWREARLLLAHVLGVEPAVVIGYPERTVVDQPRFAAAIARRAAREPLSHITGHREFWSLEFEVTPATLDPRPDSETLIESVLTAFPDRQSAISILDLGTGTGCLLLSLLSERPRATGLGVDIEPAAVAVARRNAVRLGLAERARFVVGSWGSALGGQFDLIVANPPYISTADIGSLQREVAEYEPRRALDGGVDGLDAFRAMSRDVARLLAPDGMAVIEFGLGQGDAVTQIMAVAGLSADAFGLDLAGHHRCLACRKR